MNINMLVIIKEYIAGWEADIEYYYNTSDLGQNLFSPGHFRNQSCSSQEGLLVDKDGSIENEIQKGDGWFAMKYKLNAGTLTYISTRQPVVSRRKISQ